MKIKYIIFYTFLFFQSCNDETELLSEVETFEDPISVLSKTAKDSILKNNTNLPDRYLDTLKLKDLGVTYSKIESNKYHERWKLKFTDTKTESKEISTIIYQYSTMIRDNKKNILFQLDSIIINLKGYTQSFGFEEYGQYFFSYNDLIRPDVQFSDYNFDKIIDFSVLSGSSGVTNEVRDYFIYNPITKYFNKPFSIANARFDESDKLVFSSWNMSAVESHIDTSKFNERGELIKF